jgi:hypothetical protein
MLLFFYDLLGFSRNKAVHEGIIPNIQKLAESIKKKALAHSEAWKSTHPECFGFMSESWSPPPKGVFKINFDTAIRGQYSAQAAVCRDYTGTIIKACSQVSLSCEPNFSEALAALLAASLAVSM